jgi:hypothetical protein
MIVSVLKNCNPSKMQVLLLAFAVIGTFAHEKPAVGQADERPFHNNHDDDDSDDLPGFDQLKEACGESVEDLCHNALKAESRLPVLTCLNQQQARVDVGCLDTINRLPIRAQFECAPDITKTCPLELSRDRAALRSCIRDNFAQFSTTCQETASEEWQLMQAQYDGDIYSWLSEDDLPDRHHWVRWIMHAVMISLVVCCVGACIRRRRSKRRLAMAAQQIEIAASTPAVNPGNASYAIPIMAPQPELRIDGSMHQTGFQAPMAVMVSTPTHAVAQPQSPATVAHYVPPQPQSPLNAAYVVAQPVSSYPSLANPTQGLQYHRLGSIQ